jgi:hypothetical protein
MPALQAQIAPWLVQQMFDDAADFMHNRPHQRTRLFVA